MDRLLPCLLLLLAGCAATPTSLIAGPDLAGWDHYLTDPAVTKAQVWSVRDGVLICKGLPKGYLRTRESYSDFRLSLEWRWRPGGRPGNSGVLLFAGGPADLKPWPRCLEAQLMAGKAGDFVLIGKGVDIKVPRQAERQDSIIISRLRKGLERPVGQWNRMEILSRGGCVTVWVNGALANRGRECSERSGPICLQSEGREIHFRRVRILRLP